MFDTIFKVLEILNKNSRIRQREIAALAGISIGKVNSILKELVEKSFIRIEGLPKSPDYIVTEKGREALENLIKSSTEKKIFIPENSRKDKLQAVILAAGEKASFEKPVGLLEIGSTTVIERTIDMLRRNGIEDIIVIVGYESSHYEHLAGKKNVTLINNEKYKWTGTMASLSLAKGFITGDFILIEGDMVFEERALTEVQKSRNRNCVLITNASGSGDEVFVEIRKDFIYKISKDRHQFNRIDGEMIGIAKISVEFYRKMLEEFSNNQNPYFNYEYALIDVARTYDIGYVSIDNLIWTEIERVWQYKNFINYMYPILISKENN
jgi:choline kinase/predicted transcriptional regulator